MNLKDEIKEALKIQNIELEVENVPFNLYLKDNGDILRLCFLESESRDAVIVSETTARGMEELRIVPKQNIEYIGIFYDFTSLEPRMQDKMII